MNAKYATIDTTNILFVCGGAFTGITNGTDKGKRCIGFNTADGRKEPAGNPVNADTLVKYGLMSEIVGRLPVICTLDDLTKEDFVRILTEPEDAIVKEYQLLLKKDGVKLVFEPEALEEIARVAIDRKTGARGLRSIIEDIMLEAMYEMPDRTDISKCIVTAGSIKTKQPVLIKKRVRKQAGGRADASV